MRAVDPLPRNFYDRNAVKVAPDLVGCVLARRGRRGWLLGRIIEAEAYVGEHDLACHSRAGRTARKMLNTVCGPGSDANAVLIRAAEPIEASAPWLHSSATGPGNLCSAFGIERRHNRADLCDAESGLLILPRERKPRLVRGPRVGVDYAGTWAKEPLRFWDARSAHVSRR